MNKYLKRLNNAIITKTAYGLSDMAALNFYKTLSRRFNVKSTVAAGDCGTITGSPQDMVFGGYLFGKKYNENIVSLVAEILNEAGQGTFIDIGANIGLISVPVARQTNAKVYAFEPEPQNIEYLTQNVLQNNVDDQVRIYPFALLDQNAEVHMGLSDDNFGDHRVLGTSAFARDRFDESKRQQIVVKAARLDDILSQQKLTPPVVIKMDTQGAEIRIVHGGSNVFSKADFVISEYCPYMILKHGDNPVQFLDFVKSFPYAALLQDDLHHIKLSHTMDVMPSMTEFPQDGRSTKHIDILLARHQIPSAKPE